MTPFVFESCTEAQLSRTDHTRAEHLNMENPALAVSDLLIILQHKLHSPRLETRDSFSTSYT